jgi:hypothetical protein
VWLLDSSPCLFEILRRAPASLLSARDSQLCFSFDMILSSVGAGDCIELKSPALL